MTAAFAFRTGAVSHVGCARKINEDSILVKPEAGVWAVADGMGGYGGGDFASQMVVAALKTIEERRKAADLLADFERRIIAVNAALRERAASPDVVALGTTMAALLIHGANYACLWCGDSRAYLFRERRLWQVSHDHSEAQELIDRGLLSAEDARTWPRRNVVTRALGATDKVELDLVDGVVGAGDRFLLCTDGLTLHLSDEEISAALAVEDPQAACEGMLQTTLQRGAHDNVSMIVVDCRL